MIAEQQAAGMTDAVRVLHFIPGRIRFRVPAIIGDPSLSAVIPGMLDDVEGIRKVDANPVTGSILIHYDADRFKWESIANLNAVLPGIFPENMTGAEIEAWFSERMAGTGSVNVQNEIEDLAGSINDRARRFTGGAADLRTLIPVMLFALGIGTIVSSRKLPSPKWYDYFWFGLAFYMMFRTVQRKEA